eukprot:TRINITY_DN73985_c0_g1_i1.p1 TRINITY_DN73985_c0_g1~~TRINITY_DN73985_c0_g1_i1.p1  ORF type:complete len:230 (-),score=48.40 TRINITY_DN73985_c0_g1_i1:46-735(-)
MNFFSCCSGAPGGSNVEEEQPPVKLTSSLTGGNGEEVVNSQKAVPEDGNGNGTKISAPAPLSAVSSVEDDKETAKHRLQRLIRDFAHDAVGAGLNVDAMCTEFADDENNTIKSVLRMDRRLSQVEVWRAAGSSGDAASAAVLISPLQQVESIMKGLPSESADAAKSELVATAKDGISLTMVRKGKSALCLTFESTVSRDRAYTCLRIFQMSVDQTGSGASSPPASPREG